ncbi:NAD(P)H-dependent flavin oxidoreductase [Nocardiopsis halophila]|uniref:NAD(P)H-dependent flavin oxidoreductase n=1 Tax=Nocardiopsis halophila TaxID=141692 RepID=UPI000349682A|nr:nitronate monooxygenase [Nocardiopsis halophila]
MTRPFGPQPAPDSGPRLGPAPAPGPMDTALTRLAGCRYPVVQTGMGWVAGPRLVAAACEAGALGILASATLGREETAAAIRAVKRRTDAPFGVNLRADAADARERAEMLVAEGVRVASFALAPQQDLIDLLKDGGVAVVPTVGAPRHAEKVASWGADAVMVQGSEGGGHTGPVSTTVLLPRVLDAVDIPVVAAGGFRDGRGLAAALAFGASGIGMGTRFLLTSDSTVPDAVKRAYLEAEDTVVTRAVDGLPHRVLSTPAIEALERAGGLRRLLLALRNARAFRTEAGAGWAPLLREGWAMRRSTGAGLGRTLMAANTPMMLKAAMVEGRTDAGVMSAGQTVGAITDLPSCRDLVHRTVREARETVAGLPG